MNLVKKNLLACVLFSGFSTGMMAATVVEEIELEEVGIAVSIDVEGQTEDQRQEADQEINVNADADAEEVGNQKLVLIKKHTVESCPFDFGSLCFQPAIGAIYARRDGPGEYKDIRLAAIIHEDFSDGNRFSMNALVVPGENFIDSLGLGVSTRFMRLRGLGTAVLSLGLLAKKYDGADNVRGGAYIMFSFTPNVNTFSVGKPVSK